MIGIFGRRGAEAGAPSGADLREAERLLAHGEQRLDEGDPLAAIGFFERARALQPRDADCAYRLGVACLQADQHERAERCFREALQLDPAHARAMNNLGLTLQLRGRNDEAAGYFRDSLEVDPELGQAWFNLGVVVSADGQNEQAVEHLRRAVACDPKRADWHAALGFTYRGIGRPLDALKCFEEAILLNPGWADVQESRAGCLFDMGDARSAVAAFRRACELDPMLQSAQRNRLCALNYVQDASPEEVFREHVDWARRWAVGRAAARAANEVAPERRLRVGYVSPDFRSHSVAFFIEPVIAGHDPARIEVFCYSDLDKEDAVTERLRRAGGTWQRVADWTDERLAERIRDDRIDILVDLAGHSAGGKRLRMFAGKPAPVQISWLGYLNTTGLEAMDYRISDWHACPEGWERYHTERLIRMPDSQWCYAPPAEAPEVGPLPARDRGAVTFGSVHDLTKISPRVLEAWARLLRRVPESRLIMVVPGLVQLADRIVESFRRGGVAAGRVELIDKLPFRDFLSLHNRIDINLDAFPFSGGTTTCHSLWMGVPLVTLAGQSMVSRGGVSLLKVVGLGDLIARDEQQYLAIAATLAGELDRLQELRRGLRARMARSPLTDAPRFVRALETAYRDAWRTWCRSRA